MGAKFRRLAGALLLLVFSFAFLLFVREATTPILRPEPVSLSGTEAVKLDNGEEIVATIRDALTRHDWRITLSFHGDGEYMENISGLVSELMDAALSHTGQPRQGDYIRYQYGGYTLAYSHEAAASGYDYTLTITPEYYTTPAQEEALDRKIEEIAGQLGLYGTMSDREKIAAVYRYIRSVVAFDDVHKKNSYHHLKTTAYAALINGTAVCQGYCVSVYRLLLEAGIDVRIITGTATYEDGESELHSWNLVALDGVYYNLDVTWCAQEDSDDYYMKSDASFPGHVRDPQYDSEAFRAFYPMAMSDAPLPS